MKKEILFSILGVLCISVVTFGVTYAYYAAESDKTFTGEAETGINTTLNLEATYSATKLVPLSDDLVKTAISKTSSKCIDKSKYEVCSLYKITLSNTTASENLYGYVRTESSTYTTDNLKYQIFDSSYNALTDIMTLSRTADTIVYFKKDDSNYTVTSSGNIIYYLAIWLTDTGLEQSEDYSKNFSGYIGFESVEHSGTGIGEIEANFTA